MFFAIRLQVLQYKNVPFPPQPSPEAIKIIVLLLIMTFILARNIMCLSCKRSLEVKVKLRRYVHNITAVLV